MENWITTRAASKLIGVSQVAVQQACKHGAMEYRMNGRIMLVKEEDVVKYRDKHVKVNRAIISMDELVLKLEDEEQRLMNAVDDARKKTEAAGYYPRRIAKIWEFLECEIERNRHSMPERDYYIMRGMIREGDYGVVATALGLSMERCRQLWYRALRRYATISTREAEAVHRVALLEEENERLSAEVLRLQAKCDFYEEEVGAIPDVANERVLRYAKKPLIDFALSVRALNCMKCIGVNTMEDLVCGSETEILKARNLGKTTLRELRKLVEGLGFEIGMSKLEFYSAIGEGMVNDE